jgi:hypothetical protein
MSKTKERAAPAVLQVWNADGSITLYSGGKKLDRFKSYDCANSAKWFLKGWFGEGKPQRVRHIFKDSKRKGKAA